MKPRYLLLGVHLVILMLVLVPFLVFGDRFDQLLLELIEGKRTLEVFVGTATLLMLDVFIPVPSSALSISAGMLLGAPLAFSACLLGLTLGCLLAYGFGYFFRRLNFERWHADQDFNRLSGQFSRYGYVVLLALRGVPILSEMSVIVAGFHRYPFARFFLVTLIANTVLAALYAFLGERAAEAGSYYLIGAVFILIPVVTFGSRLLWLRAGTDAEAT